MTVQERLDVLDKAGLIHWPKRGKVPRFKRYASVSPGNPIQDIVKDIRPINSQSDKRLGYPTQKPVALLKRIISASTNKGDVVFDPFCGCGTTVYAAHELERNWIGCDIAILAVRLMEHQLKERYHLSEDKHYKVDGIPNSVDSAKELWDHDKFQFEHWAVERVGGFPTKKTGDKGIDGRIYCEVSQDLRVMVLSVKGGTVRPTDIRDLIGVLSTEPDAELAGFITMREPSKAMRSAAAKAGCWEYKGTQYPRVQILTIKELLEDGKTFQIPTRVKAKGSTGQLNLPL